MKESDPALVKLAVMDEVRSHFRPDFINRIDEIVVFHALDEKNIGAIAKIRLKELEERLAKNVMALCISGAARQKITEAGFDPLYGACPLKRAEGYHCGRCAQCRAGLREGRLILASPKGDQVPFCGTWLFHMASSVSKSFAGSGRE